MRRLVGRLGRWRDGWVREWNRQGRRRALTTAAPGATFARWKTFLKPFEVRDFDLSAARRYGLIRTILQRKRMSIGSLDMQIAAHAQARVDFPFQ